MRLSVVTLVVVVVALTALGTSFAATLRLTRATVETVAATQETDNLARAAVRLAGLTHAFVRDRDRDVEALIRSLLIETRASLKRGSLPRLDRHNAVRIDVTLRQIGVQLNAVAAGRNQGSPQDFRSAPRPCLHCRLLDEVAALSVAVDVASGPVFARILGDAQRLERIALVACVGLSITLALLALHLRRCVLQPLGRLRAAIARVGAGDLAARVGLEATDEVSEISAAFDGMVANLSRLTATRVELEAEVERRRVAEADLLGRHAALTEANAELDRFVYVVSHDLRAPLRGIGNLSEWIAEDLGQSASPETRRMLDLMRSRMRRLEALLDALLEYNRIGRRTGAAEPLDIGAVVARVAAEFGPPAGFSVRYDGPPVEVVTLRRPFEAVLRHLIENALKHHDLPGGRIVVTASRDGPLRRLRVIDDGPGVPAELQERIFQPFLTLRPRDEIEGSGMGLAIALKATRVHGDGLSIESPVAGGRGAAFSFVWRSEDVTSDSAVPASANPPAELLGEDRETPRADTAEVLAPP